MKEQPKTAYKSRLPHITPIGASFFVTFRLADALPQIVLKSLKETLELKIRRLKAEQAKDYERLIQEEQKRFFGQYDKQLDVKPYGECYLKRPEIAEIVKEQLHRFDGEHYELIAYCIMPNHVHFLMDTAIQVTGYLWVGQEKMPFLMDEIPEDFVELFKIMKRIKGASARYANQKLGRVGQSFWQKDSYDHYVRNNQEWNNIIEYILQNPVKAGLVKDWKEWGFTYLKSGDSE